MGAAPGRRPGRSLRAWAGWGLMDEPLSALDPTRALQAIATLTEAARGLGCTLVATLHDVEIALAHFPRIVGLRAGAIAFDLPAAQVTPELLRALYAQDRAPPVPESRFTFDEPSRPMPVSQCR